MSATTVTTPNRTTVHQMAFNALFEKIITDLTAGDDTLLSLYSHCLDDPDGSLVTARPTPDHSLPPDAPPSWSILTNPDLLSTTKLTANLLDLTLAAALTPDPTDEVERTASRIARTLGITRSRALTYCDIGTMLTRMPITSSTVSCGAFTLDLLRILADLTYAVDDAHIAAVDAETAAYLTPVRPRQAVPGPVVLRREITRIITTHQPEALPLDPADADLPPVEFQTEFSVDTRNDDYTVFHVTVPADEGTGIVRIIDAVASAHDCSRAAAFTELCHGTVGDVRVTLNCYRNLDAGEMHLENRWLSPVATDRWMRRVTHLTVPSHTAHDGRFATESQRALLAGIDGTCRAPGCERPAATADADHVHRVDDPDRPGARTDSRDLQSLCRQCHNAKTRGLLDFTRLGDGTTVTTSIDDGHTVVTVPNGPMSTAVTTFSHRLNRRVATRAEHATAREEWRRLTRDAVNEVPF
ncbi:HNH endonuclease signature motif containing protein [Corynebacterium terpenotabidum]|uniref:HNH nuclease domain-containing protein n=1 Tax=Corynebacterium terpenotabidum Y-11 TaxID=1200352 RepID=S4XEA8_9CORY|nr:HNH endonuclease signature motif containing protein [Corynebacterium terpenotabidum]AGP29935.1 hypothetical protein A606_01400 [Corynebacterium terpenotabidum Y-11]